MRIRWLLLFVLVATLLGSGGFARQAQATPVSAALPVPGPCVEDLQASGATHKICIPSSGWNGDLVMWARGYVPGDPVFQDELLDGTSLPDLVQKLGYAWASTTYPAGGLVLEEAAADLVSLRANFFALKPATKRVYLTGASLGGLIVAGLGEQAAAGTFDGILPACGIVGSLREQVNYWGDFRVLFDYFFPGVYKTLLPLPGDPTDTTYVGKLVEGITSTPGYELRLLQLINVSQAPINPADPATSAIATIASALFYGSLIIADAGAQFDGSVYGNIGRVYRGTGSFAGDAALNAGVERILVDPAALAALTSYEARGKPRAPTVLLHTRLDPVVPVSQSWTYWSRALLNGKPVFPIVVNRYGHCNFTGAQVVASFLVLVVKVNGGLALPFLADEPGASSGDPEVDAVLAAYRELMAQGPAWEAVYLPLVTR